MLHASSRPGRAPPCGVAVSHNTVYKTIRREEIFSRDVFFDVACNTVSAIDYMGVLNRPEDGRQVFSRRAHRK
jgi:hypothetical protein